MRSKPMTLGICVLACRPVSESSSLERIEHGLMGETLRQRQVVSCRR